MTEERSKYLNTISYEERVIRNQIDYHKSSLKLRKWLISGNRGDEDDISLYKSEIAGEKIVIKTLKKALPATRKFLSSLKLNSECPICGDDVSHCEYCPSCGQKLR